MMTRKDYIATANILSSYLEQTEENILASLIVKSIAEDFADLFANDNPNFDDEKFDKLRYTEKAFWDPKRSHRPVTHLNIKNTTKHFESNRIEIREQSPTKKILFVFIFSGTDEGTSQLLLPTAR